MVAEVGLDDSGALPEPDAELSDAVKMQSLSGFFLSGKIHSDRAGRFPEGIRVHTTKIAKKYSDDLFRTKSGTVYKIRNWMPQEI